MIYIVINIDSLYCIIYSQSSDQWLKFPEIVDGEGVDSVANVLGEVVASTDLLEDGRTGINIQFIYFFVHRHILIFL
jgi:hypothetical protein